MSVLARVIWVLKHWIKLGFSAPRNRWLLGKPLHLFTSERMRSRCFFHGMKQAILAQIQKISLFKFTTCGWPEPGNCRFFTWFSSLVSWGWSQQTSCWWTWKMLSMKKKDLRPGASIQKMIVLAVWDIGPRNPGNPVASNSVTCILWLLWLPHFSVSHKTFRKLAAFTSWLSLMHRKASGAYCNMRYARVVPWLICTLDVVTAIGAGMTVKFFPLFFKEDYGLNPGYLDLCRNTWNGCTKTCLMSVCSTMLFQLTFLCIHWDQSSHFRVMAEVSSGCGILLKKQGLSQENILTWFKSWTSGQIQLLFAVYGLSFGFFTWLCEKAAARMGRVQAGLVGIEIHTCISCIRIV